MNKRQFIAPYILLSGSEGGSVIGGGSGQGGLPTDPISYSQWLNSPYAEDLISHAGDNATNEWDYATWWEGMMELNPEAYSQEVWESLNPGMLWSTYFD